MAPLTTAYAGHADITEANVKAILDQFLPQDPPQGVGLGLVFIPERVIRAQKGLKTTISWLETELGGQDATIPVPDLVAAMLERKEKEGDDLELYLLLDEENEDDVALANAANDAGIPVRNLAAGGDFITFVEPEPEPPAAEEQPPWDTPDERAAAEERSEALAALPAAAAVVQAAGIDMNLTLGDLIKLVARAIVAEMANLGAQQVAAQAHVGEVIVTPATFPVDAERPAEPVGRTTQEPGTAAFYYNAEKGTYRKARGIARDGEAKVFLTDAEQDEARAAKLLV